MGNGSEIGGLSPGSQGLSQTALSWFSSLRDSRMPRGRKRLFQVGKNALEFSLRFSLSLGLHTGVRSSGDASVWVSLPLLLPIKVLISPLF